MPTARIHFVGAVVPVVVRLLVIAFALSVVKGSIVRRGQFGEVEAIFVPSCVQIALAPRVLQSTVQNVAGSFASRRLAYLQLVGAL